MQKELVHVSIRPAGRIAQVFAQLERAGILLRHRRDLAARPDARYASVEIVDVVLAGVPVFELQRSSQVEDQWVLYPAVDGQRGPAIDVGEYRVDMLERLQAGLRGIDEDELLKRVDTMVLRGIEFRRDDLQVLDFASRFVARLKGQLWKTTVRPPELALAA
jgi:hypothetical protein